MDPRTGRRLPAGRYVGQRLARPFDPADRVGRLCRLNRDGDDPVGRRHRRDLFSGRLSLRSGDGYLVGRVVERCSDHAFGAHGRVERQRDDRLGWVHPRQELPRDPRPTGRASAAAIVEVSHVIPAASSSRASKTSSPQRDHFVPTLIGTSTDSKGKTLTSTPRDMRM